MTTSLATAGESSRSAANNTSPSRSNGSSPKGKKVATSPKKAAETSSAAIKDAGYRSNGQASPADTAIQSASQLADVMINEPHRFGMEDGDTDLQGKSLHTLKAVFDYTLEQEERAMPSIASALASAVSNDETVPEQRQTRGGAKRKRGNSAAGSANGQRIFDSTPLSELTTSGMGPAQIWEQIELRNAKVCRLLDAIIVKDEAQEEDEEDDEEETEGLAALDDLESKAKRRKEAIGNEEDEDFGEEESDDMPDEQMVRSLKSLSDADMRAIGLDPKLRAQYESGEDDEDDADDLEDDEEEDEEEEDENGEGYPGASDLSDDDEYHGKIVTEPLQTEEQQLQRKAEAEEREQQEMLKRMRLMRQLRRHDPDAHADMDEDDLDVEEEDGSDDEDHEEDDDLDAEGDKSEEEEVESEVGSEHGDEAETEEKQDQRRNSILDNLDARGGGNAAGRKVKRHKELDDDFFSIEQFNTDTDDYGDEGVDLGDDVDLFAAMEEEEEEEQENPLYYADFFAPPPYVPTDGKKEARKLGAQPETAKPAAAAGKVSKTPVSASTRQKTESTERKTTVRFAEEVKVRRIKARKPKFDPLSEGIFNLLGQGDGAEAADDEDAEDDEDGSDVASSEGDDEGEEDSQQEDEEDEAEIESSMDVDDADGMESDEGLEDEPASDEEQETAQRVAGDLFADESDVEDAEAAQFSSHEKRLQKLQQEIAQLEEENVAKKDWTVMGEASSRARPENSLLEEDLEFESNAKAKPVVTAETTTTLEDMIKKRILENNFDDVERRATLNPMDFIPSKMLELSDQKSNRGLDQIYEDELGVGDSADSRGAQLDKELQKEHEEIDGLYEALERQLDALSNAHYTPKAPQVSIQTLTNAPAIAMEESLPTSMSHAVQMAPEEVYDAGGRHNIALEGASSELTPEEKKRRHRQLRDEKRSRNEAISAHRKNVEINREAFQQQHRGGRFGGGGARQSPASAAQEKDAALRKLMGNKGVSVVGKGDGTGKPRKQTDKASLNASHLKL